MTEEQHGVAICNGPCHQPTCHHTIRPVVSGRIFLMCCVCGTVHNIPKPMEPRP